MSNSKIMELEEMLSLKEEALADLEQKLAEAERELHQQRFNNQHNLSIDQKVADKLAEAEKKLEIAVKALEFYADVDRWEGYDLYEFDGSAIEWGDTEAMNIRGHKELIGGNRARAALKEITNAREKETP